MRGFLAVAVLVVAFVGVAAWWWTRAPPPSEEFGGSLVPFEVLARQSDTAVEDALQTGFSGRVDPASVRPSSGQTSVGEFAVVPPFGEAEEWAAALGLDIESEGDVLLVGYYARRTAGYRTVGVECMGTTASPWAKGGACCLAAMRPFSSPRRSRSAMASCPGSGT